RWPRRPHLQPRPRRPARDRPRRAAPPGRRRAPGVAPMTTGLALLTYGSARNAADVPAYLSRVRQGRTPSDELVAEFQRRYELIGGSPLVAITQRLAAELERQLGDGFVVEAGMRFSEPTVAQAVKRL